MCFLHLDMLKFNPHRKLLNQWTLHNDKQDICVIRNYGNLLWLLSIFETHYRDAVETDQSLEVILRRDQCTAFWESEENYQNGSFEIHLDPEAFFAFYARYIMTIFNNILSDSEEPLVNILEINFRQTIVSKPMYFVVRIWTNHPFTSMNDFLNKINANERLYIEKTNCKLIYEKHRSKNGFDENRCPKPVMAVTSKPVIAEAGKPVIAETRKPVIAETRKPVTLKRKINWNEMMF
jgi:hypothetical protein